MKQGANTGNRERETMEWETLLNKTTKELAEMSSKERYTLLLARYEEKRNDYLFMVVSKEVMKELEQKIQFCKEDIAREEKREIEQAERTKKYEANKALELKVVRKANKLMTAAGYSLRSVHDGEEGQKVKTLKEAIEILYSVSDIVTFRYFKNETEGRKVIQYIPGNGGDVMHNYSDSLTPILQPLLDSDTWN